MYFNEGIHGNKKEVSIYGQEQTATTYKLAKMNLAIRGIAANLGDVPADTFGKDQHPDLKADFIMANPPFNQKDWRGAKELTDDPRWKGYDVPPTSNANYAWILNILSKLSSNGTAGFLLANSSLNANGVEKNIRKAIVDNDLIEAIVVLPMDLFYTTDLSVTIWILNRNKAEREFYRDGKQIIYRNRVREVLFIDARNMGVPFEKKYRELRFQEDILPLKNIYHNWKDKESYKNYKNIPELCQSVNVSEIKASDYSLVPSKYIKFSVKSIDWLEGVDSNRKELAKYIGIDNELNKKLLQYIKKK